jgi:hypothetical protein
VKILVDSDILIEVLRGRNEEVLSRWVALADSGEVILYSPVTSAEIWAGARPDEEAQIARLFRPLLCATMDAECGKLAGRFLRQFGKSHGLEIADALIAASAHLLQAQLWTRNRKHYPMQELSFR